MTSPPNSRTSPTPKKNKPLRGSPISKHPYATCHIVCQPLSLPPQHLPPPHKEDPSPPPQLPAPPLRERVKKGPKHLPHLPQPRLTTLNTSYHSTIRDLARRSVTPRSTPGSIPTHTKPGNSGRGGMTSTPSPQDTSTLTSTPPLPMRKLPLAQARAARAKAKLGSLLPPNLLRVRRPLLLKRGRPPSQVPNDAFSLLASPLPLILTLLPLLPLSLTLPLASSANPTASSHLVSPLLSTLGALSLLPSLTRPPRPLHTPPTLTPSPGPSTSPFLWAKTPGAPSS